MSIEDALFAVWQSKAYDAIQDDAIQDCLFATQWIAELELIMANRRNGSPDSL